MGELLHCDSTGVARNKQRGGRAGTVVFDDMAFPLCFPRLWKCGRTPHKY